MTRTTFKFQSTHPHGVRPGDGAGIGCGVGVSIHAPTRGATALVHTKPERIRVSIHAPTRGATLPTSTLPSRTKLFQSTHPHGVRRITYPMSLCYLCFNPRTHTGCDLHGKTRHKAHRGFNPRTHTGCDMPLMPFRN